MLEATDGKGLAEHEKVPQAHRWTREPTKLLTGRDYIRINHLRYKTLVTNSLRNRINKSVTVYCPVCVNTPHTLSHILQTCPRSHGPRVHRHNSIVEYICKRLEKQGYGVLSEPHIRDASGLLKPDIVYWPWKR